MHQDISITFLLRQPNLLWR